MTPPPPTPAPNITVSVINGPNLNLLGLREPGIYGSQSLADVEQLVTARAAELGVTVTFAQSNHEGELVDLIQDARTSAHAIILNPAAYSHTSVAIADALSAVQLPVAEVHLSNIHKREEFRHHSFVSAVADVVICGAGPLGYVLALEYLAAKLGAAPDA
ncbi:MULTISPECIES: type II 3-dehydroquinate dehydratase [Subtercola]|uniref:3-dehydroquinate dehydratase n=1 Tax=Subtercola vilae TaxID=2056433 RepID=A0A4T2BM13_9MICO|nr:MULTISPECIES: type II 3-dehydroquinate dehydratase [Subtercola]MEA9987038.1 type II 3-dehydroquinate dehydratase [Subtercola sp. RTI3]TIH32723.1 type II 3-dehydroquinate dehydratase [Subtercola vilae]